MDIAQRKYQLKIKELSRYVSIVLFLTSTVIFPRVFDMTGPYASYINMLKVITACYNLGVFLLLFKTNKKILLILYWVFILSLVILNISFINFVIFVLVLYAYGDIAKNLETYVYVKLSLVIIVFVLGFLGLNSMHNLYGAERGIRYSLGFTNPNTPSMMIFDVIAGLIYIRKGSKRVLIQTSFLVLGVFYFTDSRTLLMVYIVLLVLLAMKGRSFTVFRPFIVNAFLICFVLSIGISLLHDTPLNMALNRRPQMSYEFIRFYGLRLFGYSREGLTISVDNSYLRILVELGVIYFLVHTMLMRNMLKKLFEHMDYMAIKIILCIFLYDIFEQFTIAHGTIILVFVASYLIRVSNKRDICNDTEYTNESM